MLTQAIAEHTARARLEFLERHAVAIHHHASSQGDTWRIDFTADDAIDVAFGITLESATNEAMRRAESPMPAMLWTKPPGRPEIVTSYEQAPRDRRPRKWFA
ncbi:MAG: hypothetical protein ACOYBR_09600 [Fluviibacter sp.]